MTDVTTAEGPSRAIEGPIRVSVVVPAFNEEKLLPACLASIRSAAVAFEKVGWAWEMIVCDNNSTDQTAAVATEAGARVVFEPVNQIGRARNRGASQAQGEWLVFVDADSEASAELFRELHGVLASGKAVGGGACLMADDSTSAKMQVPLAVWNRLSRLARWPAGSFLYCRRDIFEELGGFSLKHFAAEELELARRMKRAGRPRGLRMVILPRARLRTSSRKVELYSMGEILRTMLQVTLGYFWSTRSARSCFMWYDGRR